NLDLKEVKSVSEYQRQFLKVAARLMKRGGSTLSSTCTLTKEEGEDIVDYADRELRLTIAQHGQLLGSPSLLRSERGTWARRFYPHIHDTPGFFYAILRKD
ncbi:MAG: RNA methyltransferase, partial [Thermoprotei archaeon]